jgi:hypothetical protein
MEGLKELKIEQEKTVELRSANSSRNVSREERKREASKPLYLTRYE